ncbi:Plastocyanin-like domain protein [Melia azedarach]|uniref:Plastocyanin-like domain protein n=1 Tax=Melia azedarach TaxID=155640 RepID=A0ACC1XZH9_MELAZ|nr:Plastocyanin-like domain protein [Melia azedarach]
MGYRSSTSTSVALAHGLILILCAASMVTESMANRGWYYGFNNTTYNWPWPWGRRNDTDNNGPSKIVVGGSDHWHFGFNYSDWAFENAPFYVNDALVFKYEPPRNTVFPHSVYLLPNLGSYLKCDLSRAKMVANVTDGGGEGFEFVLKRWKPYYFACGERGGLHCRDGRMKFMVMPLLRRRHY